jgi:hypothetical protein
MRFCSRLRDSPTSGSDHRSVFVPGGGGYYGYCRDYHGGGGFGLLGTLLIVALLVALIGGPRFGWYSN